MKTMLEAFLSHISCDVRIGRARGKYFVKCYIADGGKCLTSNISDNLLNAQYKSFIEVIDMQGQPFSESEKMKSEIRMAEESFGVKPIFSSPFANGSTTTAAGLRPCTLSIAVTCLQ
mgnify:CR=1 FL=1